MHTICNKYAQICKKYAKNMHKYATICKASEHCRTGKNMQIICKNMHQYAIYAINIPNMQHMQKHPTFAIYAKIYQICKICNKIPKYAINRHNMQNHTMEPLAVTQWQ